MAALRVALCALLVVALASFSGFTPPCSPAWDGSWHEIEHPVPPGDRAEISADYTYIPSPACRPVSDHEGTQGAFINLANYDRTWAAGGDILQLGIWQRSSDRHAYFVYTEDNTGGGIHLLDAPYPIAGHTYRLSIRLSAGAWIMEVREGGQALHSVQVGAHWRIAVSAWYMLETNDPRQEFFADTFPKADGTLLRTVTLRDGRYVVTSP